MDDTMEAANDFQDWEFLQPSSDSDPAPVSSIHESNSEALLQANYFSLDAQKGDSHHELPASSQDVGLIDPGFQENPSRCIDNHSCEFPPDPNEMVSSENVLKEASLQGIGEIVEDKVEKEGDYFVEALDAVNLRGEKQVSDENRDKNEDIVSGDKVMDDFGNKKTGELEKRGVVWWKMPMEFIKYCAFRMNPMFTVSVAAAVMGIAILSHRLYRMRKKTRRLAIKVTIDDKKISQAMSRAARLNEAFSVVKRVPVIRGSLAAGGTVTTWPAMSSG